MFNIKKVRDLEQKVDELSRILKIEWIKKDTYDSYSPPTIFYTKQKAHFVNVVEKLVEYLGLEIVEEPSKEASIIIKKAKK